MGRTGETIKVIPIRDSELYMISGGRRYCIAKSNGRVEIEEKQIRVARLGTLQKGTKKIWASFVICGDIDFYKDFDFDSVDAGKVFEGADPKIIRNLTMAMMELYFVCGDRPRGKMGI